MSGVLLNVAAVRIAKVEPLTSARALRGPFDYRVPDEMAQVEVGSVLRLPFGRRRVLGVVVDFADHSELPDSRLAEPIEALEAGAPPELVELGLWVARAYCSTPSRGIALALPPGTVAGRSEVRSRPRVFAQATGTGREALDAGERLGTRQRAALEALVDAGEGVERSADQLSELADTAALQRLERRGLIALREAMPSARPVTIPVGEPARPVELSPSQRHAVEKVTAAFEPGAAAREFLLHGVTGSGKTEVYLEAAAAALAAGRSVIALVPEIGLAPQTLTRFRARFGDGVAVLHSALTERERRGEWARLRTGEARICVGARSAVFAPVSDLGLIVVDEEHDPSYKQAGDPRYDARAVASERGRTAGAAVLFGSATPRPKSWRELTRLELPERVDGRQLPEVEVLDMRDRSGRAGPLHSRTRSALAELRASGGKGIVMLNRRGWSPFLSCEGCGWAAGCPRCDVSLVVHRAGSHLSCHHCAQSEPIPDACPECGSIAIGTHGVGTERVEADLARELDPMPIFRLDSDTSAAGHGRILHAFQEAPAGVLVGTQMVGKGHDFADVVLSVILDADATLRFPDFRAEERTFAMIAQLAGRSGRGSREGRVIVQTRMPDAEAVWRAAQHDVSGFLAGELERRRELRYPPFGSLVRVEIAGPDGDDVGRAAQTLGARISAALPADAELLGPAPRLRVRNRFRSQLLLRASDSGPAVDAVRIGLEEAAAAELRGLAVSVDVDPQ